MRLPGKDRKDADRGYFLNPGRNDSKVYGTTEHRLYPDRRPGLDAPNINHLPLHEKSIAGALHEGGYQTWHIGKWCLGGEAYYPEKFGFEVNIGRCEWGSPHNGYFSPWKIPRLTDGPQGKYLGDHLTDEAIRLDVLIALIRFQLIASRQPQHLPADKRHVQQALVEQPLQISAQLIQFSIDI